MMDSISAEAAISATSDIFSGGGEMGQFMRSLDWAKTPLGPSESWPQSLRTTISICLASRFPMLIWWGPELVMLYNDAYCTILGSIKHPQAMGHRGQECWPEIWDIIGPMLQNVMDTGSATWSDNQMLPLERNGYAEECYFTFSYSPIRDETGGIGGVFTAVTETTRQVLSERRLRMLHDLAEYSAEAKTAEEACSISAGILAQNAADIPFALLYLLEDDGKTATLAGSFGLDSNTPASPTHVDLNSESPDSNQWPLSHVVHTQQTEIVENIATRFDPFHIHSDGLLPHSVLVLPISRPGLPTPYGILIAGISPMRALDDDYRNFFELVAEQLAIAIGKANAYHEANLRAEALAELDRAKTTFFSNVSHEFRTPLTLMLGPVEDALADSENPLSPRQHERLQIVRRNSLRLLKLVNTLLDFSRIEAGRAEAVYEPTDLAAFTTDLASVFRSAMEQAALQFVVECSPLPELVYIDRDMWEKIVLNLLSNAFKFTFAGQISVSLHLEDNAAHLRVRDTGTGISQEELPHLFERFHRIRGVKARTHEGSGIGLALVNELVKLHNGNIHVESVSGEGTTFTIIIPLGSAHLPSERIGTTRTAQSTAIGTAPFIEDALRWLPNSNKRTTGELVLETQPVEQTTSYAVLPPKASQASQASQDATETAHAYILLADDNADMRDYMQRLLSTHYTVQAVANGAMALAAAFERKPDLVISDLMMPELDGFQLLHTLHSDARTQAVPVILLSARAGEEAAIEGLEAGADDYLVKPFSARELLARVKSHLEIARMREEATARIKQHTDRLQQLANAALAINSTLSSEEILWLITDKARAIIGAHQGITSRVPQGNWARAINAVSLSNTYASWRDAEIHIDGSGIYGVVFNNNKAVRLSQAELERHAEWLGFSKETQERPPMRGWLAAPLIGRNGQNLGLVQLSDKYDGSDFTAEDEVILIQIAQMASVAIENAHLYQQAQDAIYGRDELLSLVSHDLKNPVGTIKGYAQLLSRMVKRADVLNTDQLINGLAKIDETSTKMTRLINELLSMARLQMGQHLDLDPQPIDIIDLVQQVVAAQQQTTGRHKLLLHSHLSTLVGQWDTAHLERVFANLISNAIKYSPHGDDILVEVSQQEVDNIPQAVIAIQDHGIGIPAADLPYIFEQFHRAGNVTRSITGTGIGLSSAHQIVEQHDGTITVESTEDQGSLFTVWLPLSSSKESAPTGDCE
ncbi:MAG: ATP-binding protein [Ktedonobacteraceae bacterium]